MPLFVTVSVGRVGVVTGDVMTLLPTSGFTGCDDVTTWPPTPPLTAPRLKRHKCTSNYYYYYLTCCRFACSAIYNSYKVT